MALLPPLSPSWRRFGRLFGAVPPDAGRMTSITLCLVFLTKKISRRAGGGSAPPPSPSCILPGVKTRARRGSRAALALLLIAPLCLYSGRLRSKLGPCEPLINLEGSVLPRLARASLCGPFWKGRGWRGCYIRRDLLLIETWLFSENLTALEGRGVTVRGRAQRVCRVGAKKNPSQPPKKGMKESKEHVPWGCTRQPRAGAGRWEMLQEVPPLGCRVGLGTPCPSVLPCRGDLSLLLTAGRLGFFFFPSHIAFRESLPFLPRNSRRSHFREKVEGREKTTGRNHL